MSYKQISPLPILEGGTNSSILADVNGTIYFDGTAVTTVHPGLNTHVLTSQGDGLPPIYKSIDPDGTNVISFVDTDSGIGFLVRPVLRTILITGGPGIVTSGSGSTVTISSTGGGFAWNSQTTGTLALAVNEGYVMQAGATPIVATLPATANFGDVIAIEGASLGLWTIAQNAGQTIHFGGSDTTPGVTGSISSTEQWDSIELLCVVQNTDFKVRSAIGNLLVV